MDQIEEANAGIALAMARLDNEEMVHYLPQKSAKIKRAGYSIGILLCWVFLTVYQLPVHAIAPKDQAEEILLEEAFQLMGQKFGVFFNYDQVMVNNIMVNYNAEAHETLDAALDDVLGQADLKF